MFTLEALRREWRCDGLSDQDLADCADALNTVERHLGKGWIDSYVDESHVNDSEGDDGEIIRRMYLKSGRAILTLRILSRLGGLLSASQYVHRFKRICKKLRTGAEFPAAWSELLAAESFLSGGFQVEFAPPVIVNGRTREADLAIIVGAQRVIAEVFRPSSSRWQQEASEVMQRILAPDSPSRQLPRGYQLSIALRRLPTPDEEGDLLAHLERSITLARGGVLIPSGEVKGRDPDELDAFAHICIADRVDQQFPAESTRFLRGRGLTLLMATTIPMSQVILPPMWLIIGVAFRDHRGQSKLEEEIEQLPEGQASLLIVDTSETPGVVHAWKPAVDHFMTEEQVSELSGRSKPSAVWFMGETITPDGPARLVPTAVYENPRAPRLPPELSTHLRRQ